MVYNLAEIKDLVAEEGLMCTVCVEVDPHEVEDQQLAALWQNVRDFLDKIEEYLEESDSE